MFRQTLRLSTGECNKFPHPIPNAIVESMLLHLRILIDILLSKRSDKDDITLTDLLPGFYATGRPGENHIRRQQAGWQPLLESE